MKILAINGSHQGGAGYTQWLLELIAEGAREAGAEFATVVLAEKAITPCAGCERCHTPDHYLRCVYGADDAQGVFDAIRACDVVIYATPVYVFGMTGRMKTFLDRLNSTAGTGEMTVTKSGLFFGKTDAALHGKPFVVLTLCGNVEKETTRSVVDYFRTFGRFLDAPQVGTLARRSIGMMAAARTPGPEAPSAAVSAVAAAYMQAGRELAVQGRIGAATEKAANRHILPVPFIGLLLRFPFLKRMALKKGQAKKNGG
jgi:multimeric flavodoxin WrbA